jgi:peptide/nickel transport system permease protein
VLKVGWHAARVSAGGIATLFGVSVLVFAAMHMIPGSFVDTILGEHATSEARADALELYGLDQPLPIQYQRWLFRALQGDFGISLGTRVTVAAEFARRSPVTIELTVLAALLSASIGIPLGVLAGLVGTRRWAGEMSGAVALLLMSVPTFVLGSFFVYVFSANSLGLAAGGFVPVADGVGANLATMILPAITLALPSSAFIARTARDAVLSVLSEPFIGAAVARGLTPSAVVRRHVLRNASIPVLTVLAVTVGYLMGGSVIIEQLYSLPGFGSFVLQALAARDYPVVQAGVLLGTAAFVVTSVLVDLAYGVIDPRIRLSR